MSEPLTEEMLKELLEAPSIDAFVAEHDFPAGTLAEFLQEMLKKKRLERARVVRMADLNETFGYQIFTGTRNPSRNKVLQIALAMALTLREANRALVSAGASTLDPKCRRDAIIIFCIDHGCSLQKTNEELYRLGEETVC
ncbi:MAG: XRE family transcriptional regulator [Collinsella sp.]|nr:XRE family transcriptional regulator [Collinsella sp.]